MIAWLKRLFDMDEEAPRRALAARVRSPDPEVRRGVAERLAEVPEQWACRDLLVLLKDVFGEVREAARDALRKQGTNAGTVLVKALEDGDPKIAVPAAELLGESKDPYAVRPLLLVMKFGSVEVRAAAIRALIRYGAAAIPALEAAIEDPDPWTRQRGEEILADIRAALPGGAAPPPAQTASEAPAAAPPAVESPAPPRS